MSYKELKRSPNGYFKESDVRNLDLESIIKLMISEQSHQHTLNIVRKEVKKEQDKLNKTLNKLDQQPQEQEQEQFQEQKDDQCQ